MLPEALSALDSLRKENNKNDSPSQQFKKEIFKNPDAKIPSINRDAESTHTKEQSLYNSKYKLTLKTWDDNVESVKLHEIKIQTLEKTNQIQNEMLKNLNNQVGILSAELEKIKQKTWHDNLIDTAYANKPFTLACLLLICGTAIGWLALKMWSL